MVDKSPKTERFRSATDFPKTVQTLERSEATAIYQEMRDCLIFTNRSRAQLIRRNQEHKKTTLELRSRIDNLQTLINQLKQQKQSQIREREALIFQLEDAMSEMSTQFNTLSEAFETVGDIESEGETHWGHLVFPNRIMKLIQAVKSVMRWWNTQDRNITEDSSHPAEITGTVDEQDRRDHPERYTDQASINRSLLDR